MKWNTKVAVVFVAGLATLSASAKIEKPIVMPEAMLSVTVSDLHGFIDEIGTVAANVSPMMNGMMLKSMVGMQLGDPNLAGIAPGTGLSIVALDMTNVFVVIELAEAQSAAYIKMAQTKGMQAKYADGLLVLSNSPDVVEKGSALAATVKTSLLTDRSSSLRLALQPSAIMERNKALIDGFMQMLPRMMGKSIMSVPGATLESAQTTTKLLEGELKVGLSIASQCERAEIVFAPKGGDIRLNKTIVPKAGTRLAALVNAPVVYKENPKVNAGVLGDATMLVDFTFSNPEALATFVGEETEALINEMNIEVADVPALVENIKKWFALYGGTGCEAVNFDQDGKMDVSCIMEVKDEAGALNLLKNMEMDMAPFFKFYESMGMPMTLTFKEKVRESDGLVIHQMAATIKMDELPAQQQEQMKSMGVANMVYDIAVSDGLMFYAGEGKVEALVKRYKEQAGAAPLKARSVYPAGGNYYFDLDIGDYMAFAASMIPDSPETAGMKQQMGTLFKGVAPVTSAGFKQDGRLMWSINVPGEIIAKYGQMVMMMQMQQMQQMQMGAPQGMPAP